ncbi:NACHT domain-containing protein [Streptomyces sp. NPDC054865]
MVYTFQDQQDPLSGVSTPQGSPHSHLEGCIPFLLPLRSVVRQGKLPSPRQILGSLGCPLADAQPPGWADGVLAEGRALLLIDGLDEVPEEQRSLALAWLRDLVAAYPRSSYVLTTRPSAVAEGWLTGDGFSELTVRPMSAKDVAVFITRWHVAAASGSSTPEEYARLSALEASLKDTVRSERDLARLTTTPLLCALVCALHRDRGGHLPNGRMELYEAALSMLMVRRDRERDIAAPEGIVLTERQNVQLLQKLAYWLIRNGQSEMDHETAVGIIEDALPAMPHVSSQSDAEGVLRHLLARSGLLRAPAADTIDFVHRTFQDYLGAKAAVEARDLPLLVRHAHEAQWEDVLQMSVAHARPDERVSLLRRLIARGDRAPKQRARLHLLAMACLDHAIEIDPAVRHEVERRAAAFMPPRSPKEAGELATIGPVILGLLPEPDALQNDELTAVILTAALIGGDSALTVLKKFRNIEPAMWQLAEIWKNFDAQQYAREILSHLPATAPLIVQSADHLREVSNLRSSYVTLQGDFGAEDIEASLGHLNLSFLTLESNQNINSLEFIRSQPDLIYFRLSSCLKVSSFDPIAGLSKLTSLHLDHSEFMDLSVLGKLSTLSRFHFDLPMRGDLGRLPLTPKVTDLSLGVVTCATLTLEGITRWRHLARLTLFGGIAGASEVAKMPNLGELTLLNPDAVSLLQDLRRMPQVHQLSLGPIQGDGEVVHVRRIFPNLQRLRLWSAGPNTTVDIGPLRDMESLVVTIDGDCTVVGAEDFPAGNIIRIPRPRDH